MSFRIVTLRDNVNRLADPFTTIASVVAGLNSVLGLFGQISGQGEWVNGRFIPGDIQNRLQFVASRLIQYGLTECDVDKVHLENIIYGMGVWQGQVDNYVISIYEDKKINPQKYVGCPGRNNNTAGFDLSGLSTALLVGMGVFLVFGMKKKGRK